MKTSLSLKNLYIMFILLISSTVYAVNQDSLYVAEHYTKFEYRIPMRDGATLFTAVYIPKDTTQQYPILLTRTPYSVNPYGIDSFPTPLGPSMHFAREGYIFAYQDVRGRFMSEGVFDAMKPNNPDSTAVDESSDVYDTIDWLLKHLRLHNGKVGMWGISYPGFLVTAGSIDAHPALIAVSPQAPIAQWFIGDDFHHNGAFWLPHAFNFFSVFGVPRKDLEKHWGPSFDHGTPDGYKFFLEMGPLKNANAKYLKDNVAFWNDIMNHGTYDDFWKSRNILPHLKNIKPHVLIVGGWFDAENLYGAVHTYKTIEGNNPKTDNFLIMGPWFHGGWIRSDGDHLGDIWFNSKTSDYYLTQIELPFFNYYLKGKGELNLPEASVFETGSNQWRKYDTWPPANLKKASIFLQQDSKLSFEEPKSGKDTFDEYTSDPQKPVPFTSKVTTKMVREYMTEDQRFASRRPDVLVYETSPLENDVTICGPIEAELFVSSTGTDADYIIKLIDVLPDSTKDNPNNPVDVKLGGYQMLVRGDAMRAKFRESFDKPVPLTPGKVTKVNFTMQDINHCFLKGHKIMVQVQSSWFPLVDRNPQKFVDIYKADESDFQKAAQRIYHSKKYPSRLVVNVLQ